MPATTNLGRLYPQPFSFGHDPLFMTIGESRNEDCPGDRELCLLAQSALFSSQQCGIDVLLLRPSLAHEQASPPTVIDTDI